jgi:hypothetical protein
MHHDSVAAWLASASIPGTLIKLLFAECFIDRNLGKFESNSTTHGPLPSDLHALDICIWDGITAGVGFPMSSLELVCGWTRWATEQGPLNTAVKFLPLTTHKNA